MDSIITIRTCSLHDAETIVSFGIKTFRDSFEEMNTAENMQLYLSKTFTIEKIKDEIREPGAVYFLAEKENEPIGYARIKKSKGPDELNSDSTIEIERLYADKNYIGKKIGHLLMESCLQHAKENATDIVWLGVWEHNHRAIAFYQKWGFEKFSEHVFMLGNDAQTDFLMKKNIK